MPQLLRITGTEAVARAFRELPQKVAKKVVRGAVKASNVPIRDRVRASMPVRTGAARRDVKIISSKGPRGWGDGVVAMGVIEGRVKPTKTRGSTWYTWLIERGFTIGKRVRKGQKVVGYLRHQGNLGAQGVRKIQGKWMEKKALHALEGPTKSQLIAEILKGIETVADQKG